MSVRLSSLNFKRGNNSLGVWTLSSFSLNFKLWQNYWYFFLLRNLNKYLSWLTFHITTFSSRSWIDKANCTNVDLDLLQKQLISSYCYSNKIFARFPGTISFTSMWKDTLILSSNLARFVLFNQTCYSNLVCKLRKKNKPFPPSRWNKFPYRDLTCNKIFRCPVCNFPTERTVFLTSLEVLFYKLSTSLFLTHLLTFSLLFPLSLSHTHTTLSLSHSQFCLVHFLSFNLTLSFSLSLIFPVLRAVR